MVPLGDLVAAGDWLIRRREPSSSLRRLRSAAAATTNRRGIRSLWRALELLDQRTESPQESRLRVILVQGGITAMSINHVIADRFGEFIARTDIRLEQLGVILEYMGDYHRSTTGQWREDMTRRARIEAATRDRVMELNADDLKDPQELIARIYALAARR